jgi:hypothetical protein
MKRIALLLALACVVGFSAGCSTSKAEWDRRVGAYTFDQAVVDLGPPDKQAVLSDGTKVAEWMTRRGDRGGFVSSYAPFPVRRYPYRAYYGPGWGTYYEPSSPDYWLRLLFGADGKLKEWKKLAR